MGRRSQSSQHAVRRVPQRRACHHHPPPHTIHVPRVILSSHARGCVDSPCDTCTVHGTGSFLPAAEDELKPWEDAHCHLSTQSGVSRNDEQNLNKSLSDAWLQVLSMHDSGAAVAMMVEYHHITCAEALTTLRFTLSCKSSRYLFKLVRGTIETSSGRGAHSTCKHTSSTFSDTIPL